MQPIRFQGESLQKSGRDTAVFWRMGFPTGFLWDALPHAKDWYPCEMLEMWRQIMFKSNHCKDCGVNTILEGFVNRIPAEVWIGATLECFVCGSCAWMYDEIFTGIVDIEEIGAAKWLQYMTERIQFVDSKDSDAQRFRRILTTMNCQPIPQ